MAGIIKRDPRFDPASPCHEANYMNQLKMNWLFNFFSSA